MSKIKKKFCKNYNAFRLQPKFKFGLMRFALHYFLLKNYSLLKVMLIYVISRLIENIYKLQQICLFT